MGIGSYLWSWHCAQAAVKPRNPRRDVHPIVVAELRLGSIKIVNAGSSFWLSHREQISGDLRFDEDRGHVFVKGANQSVLVKRGP